MRRARLRLVLDANVIVSGTLSVASSPARVVQFGLVHGILLISAQLAAEWTRNVIDRPDLNKYFPFETRLDLLEALLAACELVDLSNPVSECEDPNDNHVLDLALSGHADYVVTGDKKLLKMSPFRGVPIVDPATFLSIVG